MSFNIILACTKTGGIGFKGKLPWPKIAEDISFFNDKTTVTNNPDLINCCIMGAKTYLSLGKPLNARMNIVIANNPQEFAKLNRLPDNVILASDLDEALDLTNEMDMIEDVFVIGGYKIFNEAIRMKQCSKLYFSLIENHFECDVFINFAENIGKPKFKLGSNTFILTDKKYVNNSVSNFTIYEYINNTRFHMS